MKLRDH